MNRLKLFLIKAYILNYRTKQPKELKCVVVVFDVLVCATDRLIDRMLNPFLDMWTLMFVHVWVRTIHIHSRDRQFYSNWGDMKFYKSIKICVCVHLICFESGSVFFALNINVLILGCPRKAKDLSFLNILY